MPNPMIDEVFVNSFAKNVEQYFNNLFKHEAHEGTASPAEKIQEAIDDRSSGPLTRLLDLMDLEISSLKDIMIAIENAGGLEAFANNMIEAIKPYLFDQQTGRLLPSLVTAMNQTGQFADLTAALGEDAEEEIAKQLELAIIVVYSAHLTTKTEEAKVLQAWEQLERKIDTNKNPDTVKKARVFLQENDLVYQKCSLLQEYVGTKYNLPFQYIIAGIALQEEKSEPGNFQKMISKMQDINRLLSNLSETDNDPKSPIFSDFNKITIRELIKRTDDFIKLSKNDELPIDAADYVYNKLLTEINDLIPQLRGEVTQEGEKQKSLNEYLNEMTTVIEKDTPDSSDMFMLTIEPENEAGKFSLMAIDEFLLQLNEFSTKQDAPSNQASPKPFFTWPRFFKGLGMELSFTGVGAAIGAAIGTFLLPGIGTLFGAAIGAAAGAGVGAVVTGGVAFWVFRRTVNANEESISRANEYGYFPAEKTGSNPYMSRSMQSPERNELFNSEYKFNTDEENFRSNSGENEGPPTPPSDESMERWETKDGDTPRFTQ